MELLADIFGRKYWLVEERGQGKYVVLVEEANKQGSVEIYLETGEILDSNLSDQSLLEIQEELRKFRFDFLSYIKKLDKQN